MKFTTQKKTLLTTLHKAASVTEHKNTLPVLAAAKLETLGNDLVVQAYDLEVAYTGAVFGETTKEGKVAVNAKALVAIVGSLPEGKVELAVEKTKLVVRSGDIEFKLATLPVEEYPAVPEPKDGVTFPVKTEALRATFERVAYAVSFDETRYTINGTFLEASSGALKATTTDGHRLAQHVVEVARAEDTGGGVIVSRKTAAVLLKALDGKTEAWDLTVSENTIHIASESEHIQARLIDGQFPQYEAVIPKTEGPGASFDRKVLLAVMGRMKLVGESVDFRVEDGRMTLSTMNPLDGATATEWFPVTPEVTKCKFRLNGAYLRETLGSWTCDHVTVHLPADDLTPILVVNGEDAKAFCVIMPMRS